MGYYKNLLIEWQERGYKSIDTVVCRNCVGDDALKKFIYENGKTQKCDYCEKMRICAGLEELLGLVVRSAQTEYEDATGCMGWDGREGGFLGADTFDTYDFIHNVLNYEMNIENEALLQDIVDTLDDAVTWCEYDPYALRVHEEDYEEWKDFCQKSKRSKMTISRIAQTSIILGTIGEYIERIGLISKIGRQTGFYRSRPHNEDKHYNTAQELGSPPDSAAKANRMSLKGVSMFYGAEDIDTTLLEIGVDENHPATTAKFYPTKALVVLDLTKLSLIKFPSLFDDENRDKRSPLIFLRNFAYDVSQPIVNDPGKSYRPTQAFTEYIRKKYRLSAGRNIDGIIYPSSKNGRKCCVLFFNNEQCYDHKYTKKRGLWMEPRSIVRH